MQIDTSSNPVSGAAPKPSAVVWYFSLVLASLVLLGGIGLFVTNSMLGSTLEKTKTNLTAVNAEITTLSADRQVVIKKIVSSNAIRPSLDLQTLVNNFRDAATRSNVRLQGFSVKNDTIATTLISTSGDADHSDPAATIVKMMRDYAAGQKSFGLEPILSISGDSARRTTGVQFKVIPQVQK